MNRELRIDREATEQADKHAQIHTNTYTQTQLENSNKLNMHLQKQIFIVREEIVSSTVSGVCTIFLIRFGADRNIYLFCSWIHAHIWLKFSLSRNDWLDSRRTIFCCFKCYICTVMKSNGFRIWNICYKCYPYFIIRIYHTIDDLSNQTFITICLLY